MTTYASPVGGSTGGKSLGCSQTCVSGATLPLVMSAQKGHSAVPSRLFIRFGALTRYWRKMGFHINGVAGSIPFLLFSEQIHSAFPLDLFRKHVYPCSRGEVS